MSDKPNPYKEGMLAFGEGAEERANPYRRHSKEWIRWRGGYHEARQQAAQKKEREAATRSRAWAQ